MNTNIIEIISLLIQKMLNNEDLIMEEEEVVQELLDLGYDIKDIDQAFELIYNTTDIIEAENIPLSDLEEATFYNRVFTIGEKLYLPVKLQGLIRRLLAMNLLTPKENEALIMKITQNSYYGSTATSDLWDILEEVVADQKKLELISAEIPEFKNIIPGDFKYIN